MPYPSSKAAAFVQAGSKTVMLVVLNPWSRSSGNGFYLLLRSSHNLGKGFPRVSFRNGGVRVLVGAPVFKTGEAEHLGLAGSIPVRLRQNLSSWRPPCRARLSCDCGFSGFDSFKSRSDCDRPQ